MIVEVCLTVECVEAGFVKPSYIRAYTFTYICIICDWICNTVLNGSYIQEMKSNLTLKPHSRLTLELSRHIKHIAIDPGLAAKCAPGRHLASTWVACELKVLLGVGFFL